MEKRKETMLRAQASRLLLFLLLFIGAGNSAWADTEEIVYWENDLDAANSLTLSSGVKIAITGNNTRSWGSGNGDIKINATGYKTLKNSNGAQNTITCPEGKVATHVDFYVVTNADDNTAKLQEFDGATCSDEVKSKKDYENPTIISKELNNKQSFTFTFGTKQVCFIAVVTLKELSLSSISVKTPPTKTTYEEGEFFDPAGLVITKTMSDASTQDVNYSDEESIFTFSPSLTDPLTTSNTSVTITYGGKNTQQTITVSTPSTGVYFSLSNPTGPTDALASKAGSDLTATLIGGSAYVYNGHGSSAKSLVTGSSTKVVNLGGSGGSYLKITLSGSNTIQAGDIISIDNYTKDDTDAFIISTSTEKGSNTYTFPYKVPAGSSLIGESNIYFWNKNKYTIGTLTITRPEPEASDENPEDMTDRILDHSFEGLTVNGDKYGAWTWTKSGGNGPMYPYGAASSTAFEFWHSTASSLTFSMQQTINDLPVGTYGLKAKANNSFNGLTETEGGHAYLFAQVGESNGFNATPIEYNANDATVYNDYTVIFEVTEEGQPVTIGFKATGVTPMVARWFSGDDFTLEYYGTESTQSVTPALYTVQYVMNGYGDQIASLQEVTALPSTLPNPTATGVTFAGWYTDGNMSVPAVAGATITENTILYAKWITPISEPTTLTFSDKPSNTINFQWGGTIQKPTANSNALAEGADTKALKFDSHGSLSFVTSDIFKLDLYFEDADAGLKIKIDGTDYTIDSKAHVEINSLSEGNHTIVKGEGNQSLLCILKLSTNAQKESDLRVQTAEGETTAKVEINTNSSPFIITTSSDGLLSITNVSNNKISALIDDNGKLVISTSTSTVQGATITIVQAATDRYKAGKVTVTVNVDKPMLAAPTVTCTDNIVTITSAVAGATIYYTTDGTDPKESNTKQLYTGVFLITQNGTVKAYATANDYKDSETTSEDVEYQDIQQYAYAVNAVDASGNIIKTFASGAVKDQAVTVYYPIIFKEGDKYYKTEETTFAQTFDAATPSSADDRRDIRYVEDASVVAFVEGEQATVSASGNSAYSNGGLGWVAGQNWNCRGLDVAKLPAGKYSFETFVKYNQTRGVVLRNTTGMGSSDSKAATILCDVYSTGVQTREFTLTSETSIRLNGGNNGTKSSQSADFDYAFIKRLNGVVFTTQPIGDNYSTGSNHTLSVAATAYFNGDVAPSYQWYKNTTNSNEGGTIIPGATNTTFTVPTEEANEGITYYYCVATYTEGGETITAASLPAEAIVCEHPVSEHVIGNDDRTSGYETVYSNFYSLGDGESREFNFKNFSEGSENWFNWILFAANSKFHANDTNNEGYVKYVGMRPDNWDDVATNGNGIRTNVLPNGSHDLQNVNWDTFKADMTKGATVTVKVARKDNNLFFYFKSVADQGDNPSNNTYITTFTKALPAGAADPLQLYFTVNHAQITEFQASNTKPIYLVTAAMDGDHGTNVEIYNAEGMLVPDGTYFSLGDEIRVVATPADGYLPSVWTSTGTQGTIDLANNAYVISRIDKDTHVTVNFGQNVLSFTEPTPERTLPNEGTLTYVQLATNVPVGQIPTYSVISTTGGLNASIVQEEGSANYELHVTGTGTVTVAASLGGLYTTYTLTVGGVAFANRYEIYKFDNHTFQTINDQNIQNETYEIVEAYGKIKDLWENDDLTINNNGEITGIPALGEDGGALVIKASSGDAYALYTLTIPYEKYVWNFYQEGDGYSNTNPVSRIKTGPLVNNTNPGAADLVEMAASVTDLTYDSKCTEGTINDLKKKQTWLNMQKSDTEADASYYWNYTFKTCRYNDDRKTINYTNEVLFSYKNAVHGDNARVITNTAGLVFNCDANKFGLNDNRTTVEPEMRNGQVYYTARNIREMDRAVLLQGYSSFTIPHVKAGYYVKLYWYRHSDNAGDQFRVQNAKDLDGRNINPNDVLRFTGSAYYRNPAIASYRGSTFLQPQYDGADITITIANSNWTELYRIEVTDKMETDLKICEEEIAGLKNGSENYATTDMWNALDLNVPANYNTLTHSHKASMLTSKIQTYAKGHQLIEYAPEIHFSGYPGHCFTWNGWLNTTIEANVEGAAMCVNATNTENGVNNALPIDPIWVGNNIRYTAHHLKDVHGTGTIKLTLRTHTGKAGEAHYTLDKTEATVAVGEYSVQDYPYTWDFTDYNLSKENAYNGKTFEVMNGTTNAGVNDADRYGNWASNSGHVMGAYTTKLNNGTVEAPKTSDGHVLDEKAVRHKPFFAQGAQLNLGDGKNGEPRTILESEGLRINIPAVDSNNNSAVTWTEKAGGSGSGDSNQHTISSTIGTEGALTVNGTITIPEVPQGMFVFVRSANRPTSVEGAVSRNDKSNNSAEINSVHVQFYDMGDGSYYDDTNVKLNNGDIPANVWVYEQTLEGNHDVVITPNGAVEALGVTNYFKPMTKSTKKDRSTWGTDARNERIDYSNTGIFTKHDLKAYTATSYNMPGDEGTLHLEEIKVVPASTGNGHGLVVYDAVKDADLTTVTARPLLPLFVPACNILNGTPDDRYLKGLVAGGQTINATGKEFTLTDQYYMYSKSSSAYVSDVKVSPEISFYILREMGEARANSAYLQLSEAHARARALYLVISDGDSEIDGIEDIELGDAEIVKVKSIYTLSGTRLNTLPTKKGIYIINGKKVYIK